MGCDDLVGGFTDIRSAQLAASILFLAAVVFMILGQKRFLPLSESAEEAEENEKEGVEGGGKKGKKRNRNDCCCRRRRCRCRRRRCRCGWLHRQVVLGILLLLRILERRIRLRSSRL